jgi:hypothetical protein
MQKYLPPEEFQKRGLPVQAQISSNSSTAANVMYQIMTGLSEAVSEDRIMAIKNGT